MSANAMFWVDIAYPMTSGELRTEYMSVMSPDLKDVVEARRRAVATARKRFLRRFPMNPRLIEVIRVRCVG